MSDMRSRATAKSTRNSRLVGAATRCGVAPLVLVAALAAALPAAANVCVRPPLRVRHLQGIAVYGHDDGERILPGAQIRIERRDSRGEPLTLVVGPDGRFSVEKLAPGQYDLTAESKGLDRIHVLLVVKRACLWHGRDKREVVLRFGFDPNAPCGGSSVELRKRPSVSAAR